MPNDTPTPTTTGLASRVELDDLRRVLRVSAGADAGIDLDADIADTPFEDLGYDSIAVMETASALAREFGVTVDDERLFEAETPRLLLNLINSGSGRRTDGVPR